MATDGIYANPEGSGFPANFSLVDRVGLVVAHPAAEPEWRRDLEGRVEMQPLGADEARRRARTRSSKQRTPPGSPPRDR